MTLVVGTAGHIDHGKTALLRALTGIDADRLPEERRRGMTIDVGYAHLTLDDGTVVDLVDVPGHDRLVGNMLVGAGEIDAALLVVAADDGPSAQTLEHVALLDALGIVSGLAVVTKIDIVDPDRVAIVRDEVERLLAPTSLSGVPVIAASAVSGAGLEVLREALRALAARVPSVTRPPSLAVDRAFSVKGRGVVVTGSLRGGPLAHGDRLRLVPGGVEVRIREIQVHGSSVERVTAGGRVALNVAGVDAAQVHRGLVLTADPEVVATSRVLAAFRLDVADRARGRIHAGTTAVDGAVSRAGRDALRLADGRAAGIVRFDTPIALRPGDRFLLRRGPTVAPVGAIVIDTGPPRGLSRRRQTPERVTSLASAGSAVERAAGRLALHGAVGSQLAPDVADAGAAAATAAVMPEAGLETVRAVVARTLRGLVSIRRDDAADAAASLVDGLVRGQTLVRDGDVLRRPGATPTVPDPAIAASMDRLEHALATAAPPPLGAAARAVGCPPGGIRQLERDGRIVVLEPDLAYAMSTYRDLAAEALRLAARAPLTPSVFRDATGTSRKFVMAILEDLDRRAILRRTADGHVPGPKAPAIP